MSIVHRCSCGRTYTQDEWEGLALVGYSPATDDPEGALLELRNCGACASTCARGVASLSYLVKIVNRFIRLARMHAPALAESSSGRPGTAIPRR